MVWVSRNWRGYLCRQSSHIGLCGSRIHLGRTTAIIHTFIKRQTASRRPNLVERLLRALMIKADFEALLGDLREIYDRKRDRLSKEQADKWYRRQIITAIMAVLRARASRLGSERLRIGQSVRIIAGPLAGVVGVIDERRGETRVELSVKLLERQVSVQIESDAVRAD